MENTKCFRMRRMLPVVMSFSWLVPDHKTYRNLAMILALLLVATVQAATTRHVDDDQENDDGDGSTWETAKKTIQAAIDEAEEGDIILVNDGSYKPIWTKNKAITIRSVNGAEETIINGGGSERCATLEEFGSILEGFTLQNGYAAEGGGAYGGTLTKCTLNGNQAVFGGGASYSEMTN